MGCFSPSIHDIILAQRRGPEAQVDTLRVKIGKQDSSCHSKKEAPG